jgi:hypothetical protein
MGLQYYYYDQPSRSLRLWCLLQVASCFWGEVENDQNRSFFLDDGRNKDPLLDFVDSIPIRLSLSRRSFSHLISHSQ